MDCSEPAAAPVVDTPAKIGLDGRPGFIEIGFKIGRFKPIEETYEPHRGSYLTNMGKPPNIGLEASAQ